ncbi:uncharacterized protein LOC130981772 [Arachis stenosperma]|uniref:uncharacterized protein LOC130981772 n=1 Tax=Arachis stenosperma TaxID=217475 RepID=UPI0025AD1F9A|nr:uncharacterized protein LOC130981772 [Arachis stenosperma]
MRPQDKTTLESASNGSMKKYKTIDEAWQLISNLAESTMHHRKKQDRSKAIAEVSSSRETAALAQSICEMTNLLKQMQLNQQVQQAQPPPPQQSQQLVPQRVCGVCADYSHYTDECPQLQQEDNMVASTHNFYDRPNQGYNQGGNHNHGWKDNSNQNWRDNNNRGGRDNQRNQRWNNNNNRQQNQPYRAPHLRQFQGPQNTQQQTSQFTHPSSSPNEELLQSFERRQQTIENNIMNNINASLNGLTSTMQALVSQIGSM